ncbi:MAG: protein kinase [Myxococcaceae bacterium]
MYRLIGRLEQSQLADLFRAERTEGSRESVVVKLFHLKTTDAAYAKVIADVARALQPVSHAGVARVLDVGLVKGVSGQQLAVVRQDTGKYSLGLALQRLNTREVFLPPALALTLALELLEVLAAAHDAGVVHGALTPGNVLLAADGRVSVADFGALSALQASPTLKKTFGARGRGSYRAPELGATDQATTASDLYALGAIIYELLTLREAATGNASVSTRSERLPPPSRLVRRLHSRIDPVIMRALEKSPGRRHRSCTEFMDGIREFLVSQGGIPPKSDLEKFVSELFPNEVQLVTLGPVPFEQAFEVTELSGVDVGSVDAAAVALDDRRSFSGGPVDDRTPTSDGLPVFTEEMVAALNAPTQIHTPDLSSTQPMPAREPAPEALTTQPDVRAVQPAHRTAEPPPEDPKKEDWVAPPAAVQAPAAAAQGPTPVDPLKGRVRVVEDFAALANQPKPPPPLTRRQKVAKTIMTFAVPFKREGDPSIPSYSEMEKRGARQVRVVSFLATMILFGVVTGSVYAFLKSTNDVKGTLISYLPAPIQRELEPPARPPPPPSGDGKITLKLQDFNKLHPDKAFNPDKPDRPQDLDPAPKPDKPDKVDPPPKPKVDKPDKPDKPKQAADCYDAPKGKTAFLTVESQSAVRVEIDGKRVCVNATKVPVTAGSHKVTVVEPKTKQEYASTNRFEAGKVVKLMPVFQKR